MSRYISPKSPLVDDAAQPIVHFDATEPRKQKMRRAAEQRAAPVRAIDAGNLQSTGTRAAPKKNEPDPAQDSPNGVPSELNVFLTELHQYFDESPVNSTARFPTLSRVAAFLQGALSPASEGTRLAAEDERSGTTSQSTTTPFQTGQDLVARPTSKRDEEVGANQAVLADPQALEAFMIDFIVEQTGYPREVVELDADLEADLGIDSIKKAQLFAELRDYFDVSPNITREDLTLDDFPTLRHVVHFIQKAPPAAVSTDIREPAPGNNGIQRRIELELRSETAPLVGAETYAHVATVLPEAPELEFTEEVAGTRVVPEDPAALEAFMIDFVVEQTGYPREVVELDADLEADLGIDSIKKAQLFAELRDYFDVSPNITQKDLTLDDFPTLRHVVNFIQNAAPTASNETVATSIEARSTIAGEK